MPINFTINHDERFVEAHCEGETRLEDVENFLDALVLQGALPYRKLFDGRFAIAVYNDHDVMMLGARMSAYAANLEPRGAIAFVAANQDAADLGMRFLNLSKSNRPAKIFLEEDKARQWLGQQPEV